VGKVAALIAPPASVRDPFVVGDPGLSNKPFAFQDLRCRQPAGMPVCQDERTLDKSAKAPIPVRPSDTPQAMFVLVLVRVHRCAESDQVIRGLLVLDTKMSSTVNLSSEGRIPLVT
jgi:hypothetical protein